MEGLHSRVGTGEVNVRDSCTTPPSKFKTYGFAIAIIVGIGGLALGGVGLAGYFHIGALSNMAPIHAIIMMMAGGGGGTILLIMGIVGTVKNCLRDSRQEQDAVPALHVEGRNTSLSIADVREESFQDGSLQLTDHPEESAAGTPDAVNADFKEGSSTSSIEVKIVAPKMPTQTADSVWFALGNFRSGYSEFISGLKVISDDKFLYSPEKNRQAITQACQGKKAVVLIVPIYGSESFLHFLDESPSMRHLLPFCELIEELKIPFKVVVAVHNSTRSQNLWGSEMERFICDMRRLQPLSYSFYQSGSMTSTQRSDFLEVLRSWGVVQDA